jgi:hypothetical protein
VTSRLGTGKSVAFFYSVQDRAERKEVFLNTEIKCWEERSDFDRSGVFLS